MNNFANKRILITGAAGFIGRNLLSSLQKSGATLASMEQKSVPSLALSQQFLGDITDRNFVNASLRAFAPHAILHLAAFRQRNSEFESFEEAIRINLMGSLNVFTAARHLPSLEHTVVLGTGEEYGAGTHPFEESQREEPVSAYSYSKLCMTKLSEVLSLLGHLSVTVLRPSLAYGPEQASDMFLPALISSLHKNREFPMSPGEQTRDFLYVEDLVEAMLASLQNEKCKGQTINVASGNACTLKDLALKVERMMGKSGLVQFGKVPYRKQDIMNYQMSTEKAHELLGWRAKTQLDDGLRKTIASFV